MKNRLIALCAALCLVLPLGTGALAAQSTDTALETVKVLGIMVGDENGNMNLSSPVTRAEFVKMMTAASAYQGTVGNGYGSSLFKDVKSSHWAGEYIRLGVEQGWFHGYVDGTFRPDSSITLEEGCTALLRLLGYDSGSLAGSFPSAQLSKSSAIGLLDDLAAVQGQVLTRQDCVTLFYNLLTTQTSSGSVYGATLGYTITNGEVDYSALVAAGTKGPYVASSGSLELPFRTENAAVYRNGSASDLSAAKQYDVYYYNANLRTVWLYSSRVTGTLTAVSPNRAAPSSVTVAGVSYDIGTSAAYKLSSQGGFADGDTVTLLLGMNGEVVDVITAQASGSVYYGVVVSSEKTASSSSTSLSDTTSVQIFTQVACSDGTVRTFYHSGSQLTAGRLVSAAVSRSGTVVKYLSTKSLSGTVSSDGAHFAGYPFAAGVEILDTDSSGGYARIYPSRLVGVKLPSEHVRYYTLDSSGCIDRLILDEATGDTLDYVYLTSANSTSEGMSVSGTYQYLRSGTAGTISGSTAYSVSTGGAVLLYDDGSLKTIRQLQKVALTQLSDRYAMAGNQKYLLDENVQVLLQGSGGCYATTLSAINAEDYSLRGWYDELGCPGGGRIRILVATVA
ncbi:S-layer homology domain-containing protein [Intestinimonas massiliensis]|uniref:S-layer homology domain-containing protein n=1 Tax=Intestinimonas massiliensis (ex Afouda et al. 2020) TaxID=1673721 RepID=A0AAW5JTJ0_9FIRM|nr:S-layer homology domain-containing protein [Intestinimonas massiliensis (ex Afouda et al. 2020)]MCQ4771239.1 S-layer homology domain-containing protein [Intestinimonas massiliensis (ex Afouda et al. 2020)]